MTYTVKEFQRKKTLIYSAMIGFVLFLIFIVVASIVIKDIQRQERYETTEAYFQFQSDIKALIQNQMTLLEGYQAYLMINGYENQKNTLEYLNSLTRDNMKYIRNIAIIEDTTIVCNYPLEGNEESIGIDLAEIETQREVVLRTKNDLKSGFQGPIDLVQGGKGFIIRRPLINSDNAYWGQVSIVLKADEIYTVISSKADEVNLEVLILEEANAKNIIYGDPEIREQNPISFNFIDEPIAWGVLVIKKGGWSNSLKYWGIGVTISCLLAIVIIVFIYFFLKYLSIKYRSNHDSLTGLLNRQFLKNYEEVVCSTANREDNLVGIMIIDVDKFKSVNDTYGHHVGDLVLVEVARIIDKCSRNNETVFRVGGDEFMIVIPKANTQSELEKLKARLLDTYNSEFKIPGYDFFVSISIGIICDKCIGLSFGELIKKADKKMYEMKD